MKKKIIIFSIAVATLGLMAFSVMDWNDSETDQVETSVSEDVAINTPVTEKVNKGIFVGPRQLDNNHRNPYLTVVPEKQAEYEGGMDALMEYLKENSKEARGGIQMHELQHFELLFTVTKKGTIENVRLDGASGYLSINNRMVELITKAPGKWKPAQNSKGEKVDQELIVLFGLRGC